MTQKYYSMRKKPGYRMTAKEYVEMFRKTKVHAKQYPIIVAIAEIMGEGEEVTNLLIASRVGKSAAGIGKATKGMEEAGVIQNLETRHNKSNWILTSLGWELNKFIVENTI